MRVCPQCGRILSRGPMGQVYCTSACKREADAVASARGLLVPEPTLCEACRMNVTEHGQYCCPSCLEHPRHFDEDGKVEKICETCGKEFTVPQCVADLGAGKYCSVECYDFAQSEARGDV